MIPARPRTPRHRRLRLAFVGVLASAGLGLAACGSDDDDSAATTEAGEATSDSYAIVSDAAVAKGYADVIAGMTRLTADPSTADEESLEAVHETWESFEGTVKQNDSDAYLASEEALDAFLDAGAEQDATAMAAATAKMTTTSGTYLAAHPG